MMILLFVVAVVGCAPVAPWERGVLAKTQMTLDPYPMQSAVRAHVHASREAGAKADTAGGGGCGCY